MEKMLCLIFGGRLVFAFAFIVSAWREYIDEDTWYVFNLNEDGVAAEQFIVGLGIVIKAKNIIGLGLVMKLFGGISFIFSTYLGALLLLIYQVILQSGIYTISTIISTFSTNSSWRKFGVNNVLHHKFCDRLSQHVNQTVSTDDGMAAICYSDSIAREEFSQKICDQINEIEKLASSNPLFTQSNFNTFFLPFIKGFGIVAALVFFITMKHKYGVLKKHKTK